MTTYHDWASETYTETEKLSRLRSYMGEIQAMLGSPDVSADGKAVDRTNLLGLLRELRAAEKDLQQGLPKAYSTARR